MFVTRKCDIVNSLREHQWQIDKPAVKTLGWIIIIRESLSFIHGLESSLFSWGLESFINYEVPAFNCVCPNVFQTVKAFNSQQAFVSGRCDEIGRWVFRLMLVCSTIIRPAQYFRIKGLLFYSYKEKEWDTLVWDCELSKERGSLFPLASFPYCQHNQPKSNLHAIAVLTLWLWCNQSILFDITDTWTICFTLSWWTKWQTCAEKQFQLVSSLPLVVTCLRSKTDMLEFWW